MLRTSFDTNAEIYRIDDWRAAADTVKEEALTPIHAKALYTAGMIRHLLEGAGRCLETFSESSGPMELSAYVLVADAIELLGRCGISTEAEAGNRPAKSSKARFLAGAKKVLKVASGDAATHSADDLWALRNFLTHGAAIQENGTAGVYVLDSAEELRPLIESLIAATAVTLTNYWDELLDDESSRALLAGAEIEPMKVSVQKYLHIREMLCLVPSDPGKGLLHARTWDHLPSLS